MQTELIIFYSSYAHIMRGLYYGSYLLQESCYGYRGYNITSHDYNAFLGYICHGVK